MSYPLVSVLMTAFNRAQFIAEAIESVLASTYSNFELIIVDDCSTDHTVSVARNYLSDKRVRIYVNETNLKQFGNRNKAASYAKGKYIKYADSDDIIYPHSLQMMVDIMEAHPLAAMGFCHFSGNSKFPLPHFYTSAEIVSEHYFSGGILFTGPIGTIIQRAAFESVGGFDYYGMPSDNHLSLKIASRFPVVSMYRDLIWWRTHSDQAFNGVNDDVNIIHNFKWNMDILLSDHFPLDPSKRKKLVKDFKRIFIRNLVKRFLNHPAKFFAFKKLLRSGNINFLQVLKEAF